MEWVKASVGVGIAAGHLLSAHNMISIPRLTKIHVIPREVLTL
jgi:hypothetical protein